MLDVKWMEKSKTQEINITGTIVIMIHAKDEIPFMIIFRARERLLILLVCTTGMYQSL
jgi:hypothetical protein